MALQYKRFDGWKTAESQIINGYEVTGVRYVLGELFDTSCNKALICIGINPSTAIPEQLDPTLKRVQKYAKRSGEYGAWYMLNVYPQRATNPDDMDIDPNMEIHRNNLIAIKNLLSEIKEADVWCVLGVILSERGNTCMTCCLEIKKKILTVLSACSMQTITSRHTKLLRKGILNTLF